MPVKNTALYLSECLDSIMSQSFVLWELIVVDDHSTDDSLEILQRHASDDSRITVLPNRGEGIIEALRLAYRHAKGQYITRMDSDDIMAVDKLDLMYQQLVKRGIGHLAVGHVAYFCEGQVGNGYLRYAKWLNKLTSTESNFLDIYKECSIPSPCWMIDRVDLDRCGAFDSEVYPEDYDLAFRFRLANLIIAGIPQVIHRWRDYPSRTSRTDDNYADNRFAEIKLLHFVNQDYKNNMRLILWGAGPKGKNLARLLQLHQLEYTWICNNPRKIGQNIYGQIMEDQSILEEINDCQVIIAISGREVLEDVEKIIQEEKSHQYFWFC